MSRTAARLLVTALLSAATPAYGQIPQPPDPANIPVRVGPLLIDPRLALSNLGIDTNVFNEPDDQTPESDVTLTLTPSAALWLRMGRTWVTGSIREDVIWYREFESERSLNNTYRVGWIAPLTRVAFAAGAGWVDTRERPGFEIDARADRQEREVNAAAEVRALARTFVGGHAFRRRVEFEAGEFFRGADLRRELTRTKTFAAATVRREVTPLTSVTLEIARESDRFELSPLRDSNSTRLDLGVAFNPFALISGTARFGYRHFRPLASDLPRYSGATAAVNLAYVALGSTRVAVQAVRDVEYSFEIVQPYYLQSGISASVGQQIYGPVDVEARAGAQRLAYRTRETLLAAASDRIDRVRSYGFGFGYRLGQNVRLGFNVDHQRRTSPFSMREYEGLRSGVSVVYGR